MIKILKYEKKNIGWFFIILVGFVVFLVLFLIIIYELYIYWYIFNLIGVYYVVNGVYEDIVVVNV